MEQPWPRRLDFRSQDFLTPTPAAELGRLHAQAQQIAADHRAAGVNWRPWIGDPVVSELLAVIRESGAVGFSCGRIDLAEALHRAGESSITLTRPPIGGNGPTRLAQLARSTELHVICEHFVQAEVISQACQDAVSQVQLLVNVDSGRQRLGVRPGPDLSDLLEGLQTLPCVSVVGLALAACNSAANALGSVAEHQLQHVCVAALRSFARGGRTADVVSLDRLRGVGSLKGRATETRTPLDASQGNLFAIMASVIGRPTRDIAVIDAGAAELFGFREGDAVSSEAHFKEIRCESAALFVCGSAQDLLVGDVVALPTKEPAFRWAQGMLVGDGTRWRYSTVVRG